MNETQKQLENDLNELAKARAGADAVRQKKHDMIADVEASDEFMKLDKYGSAFNSTIAELEARIRAAALVLHAESCELPDRVTVKQFTVVTIPDKNLARDWCLKHFTPALELDEKIFKDAVKQPSYNIPAELATVTKEARAQIATKL